MNYRIYAMMVRNQVYIDRYGCPECGYLLDYSFCDCQYCGYQFCPF